MLRWDSHFNGVLLFLSVSRHRRGMAWHHPMYVRRFTLTAGYLRLKAWWESKPPLLSTKSSVNLTPLAYKALWNMVRLLTRALLGGGVWTPPPPVFRDSEKTAARSAAGFSPTLPPIFSATFVKISTQCHVRSGHQVNLYRIFCFYICIPVQSQIHHWNPETKLNHKNVFIQNFECQNLSFFTFLTWIWGQIVKWPWSLYSTS